MIIAAMRCDLAGTFPKSAKTLATNPDAYAAALERDWAGWRKTGLPLIDGVDPRRWPLAPGLVEDAHPAPVPMSFLRYYYGDKNAVINAVTGKPMAADDRNDFFKRLMRWQINNKRRPHLPRPITVYAGQENEMAKTALRTVATAAAVAAGASLIPSTAPAAPVTSAGASSGGAVATSAAGAGGSNLINTISSALDLAAKTDEIASAVDLMNTPKPAASAAPVAAPSSAPPKKPVSLALPALLALALLA